MPGENIDTDLCQMSNSKEDRSIKKIKIILMKKLFIIAALALVSMAAGAQNYIVVNTETIFKSISSYTSATNTLDQLAKTRQSEIDAAFAQIETMYNAYMQQKAMLGEAARAQQEKVIIDREAEATKRQEDIFGPEGEMMKRRTELLKPIEDRVLNAIKSYAATVGGALVLDVAENPMVLYYAPSVDRTQEIINMLR